VPEDPAGPRSEQIARVIGICSPPTSIATALVVLLVFILFSYEWKKHVESPVLTRPELWKDADVMISNYHRYEDSATLRIRLNPLLLHPISVTALLPSYVY